MQGPLVDLLPQAEAASDQKASMAGFIERIVWQHREAPRLHRAAKPAATRTLQSRDRSDARPENPPGFAAPRSDDLTPLQQESDTESRLARILGCGPLSP